MRTRWIVISVVVVGALGMVFLWYRAAQPQAEEQRTVIAERRSLLQDVVFTGNVQARRSSTLGFETAGTVQAVLVDVGQVVEAGHELIRLDDELLQLEAAKTRADRAHAEEAALLAWQEAEATEKNTLAESAQLVERRKQAVRDAKIELGQQKEVWQQEVREDGDEAATTRVQYLTVLKAETTYRAAQQLLAETQKTVAKIDEVARRATTEARVAHVATQQAASNVAGISSLEASDALARARVTKTVLQAPFAGVITQVAAEVGQFVSIGSALVTVQTIEELEVVADVPEADAVKLASGLFAEVLLDAYPTEKHVAAEVVHIAPAATIIEGVPTYEVTLYFVEEHERLHPGLSADVRVKTGSRDGVIAVPRRAVLQRDAVEYVRVVGGDGQIIEREVTTGLLGSDGAIEITEGLSEGERILVQSGL